MMTVDVMKSTWYSRPIASVQAPGGRNVSSRFLHVPSSEWVFLNVTCTLDSTLGQTLDVMVHFPE